MLVLPLWTVFYTVITALSVLGIISLLGQIPILGLLSLLLVPLLATAIHYIIAMHPYLVGIRIGLRVLGFKTVSSQERLLGSAIVLGLIEALITFALLVVITAVFILNVQTGMTLSDAADVPQITDPMAELSRRIVYGGLAILSVISSIAVMAVRAALLPVLASAAAGRNETGRLHGPLGEFGASFFTMFGLLLMITAISTVVIPFMGSAVRYVGLTSVLTGQLDNIVLFVIGEKEIAFTLTHALLVVTAIVVSIWLFCLQCAGAALSYERRSTQQAEEIEVAAQAEQASSLDIAELRRSRMSNNSD